MSEPAPDTPATIALESSCPRCGRPMLLPLPADANPSDAQRLALLVLCDACLSRHSCAPEQPEPAPVRWPYADD